MCRQWSCRFHACAGSADADASAASSAHGAAAPSMCPPRSQAASQSRDACSPRRRAGRRSRARRRAASASAVSKSIARSPDRAGAGSVSKIPRRRGAADAAWPRVRKRSITTLTARRCSQVEKAESPRKLPSFCQTRTKTSCVSSSVSRPAVMRRTRLCTLGRCVAIEPLERADVSPAARATSSEVRTPLNAAFEPLMTWRLAAAGTSGRSSGSTGRICPRCTAWCAG